MFLYPLLSAGRVGFEFGVFAIGSAGAVSKDEGEPVCIVAEDKKTVLVVGFLRRDMRLHRNDAALCVR